MKDRTFTPAVRPAAKGILRPRSVAILTLLLYLTEPRLRAEDRYQYKYQSYREQGERIQVLSHYARAEKTFGAATALQVVGLVDAISGASPTGAPPPPGSDQVPMAGMTDKRRSVITDLVRQFGRHQLTLQYAYSKESDYRSQAYALTHAVEFNQRNTTLRAGYGRDQDSVFPAFFSEPRRKRGNDAMIGLTQLVNPATVATVNLTRSWVSGYLSDPYKLVQKRREVLPGLFLPQTFPEHRPSRREKWILFTNLARSFSEAGGSIDASYRFLRDDFGSHSHTSSLEWHQKFGERWIVRPGIRLYRQSAADFYLFDLDPTPITPVRDPDAQTPFYSSDYRLSSFQSLTYGLKLLFFLRPEISLDVSWDRYEMRGRDGVTAASAYPTANVVTVGGHLWF